MRTSIRGLLGLALLVAGCGGPEPLRPKRDLNLRPVADVGAIEQRFYEWGRPPRSDLPLAGDARPRDTAATGEKPTIPIDRAVLQPDQRKPDQRPPDTYRPPDQPSCKTPGDDCSSGTCCGGNSCCTCACGKFCRIFTRTGCQNTCINIC